MLLAAAVVIVEDVAEDATLVRSGVVTVTAVLATLDWRKYFGGWPTWAAAMYSYPTDGLLLHPI